MTMVENSFIKKLQSSGRRLVVFYGSQTGTAEEFAGRLAKEGIRYQMKGMVADPEECNMVGWCALAVAKTSCAHFGCFFNRTVYRFCVSFNLALSATGRAADAEGHRQIVGRVLLSDVRRGRPDGQLHGVLRLDSKQRSRYDRFELRGKCCAGARLTLLGAMQKKYKHWGSIIFPGLGAADDVRGSNVFDICWEVHAVDLTIFTYRFNSLVTLVLGNSFATGLAYRLCNFRKLSALNNF